MWYTHFNMFLPSLRILFQGSGDSPSGPHWSQRVLLYDYVSQPTLHHISCWCWPHGLPRNFANPLVLLVHKPVWWAIKFMRKQFAYLVWLCSTLFVSRVTSSTISLLKSAPKLQIIVAVIANILEITEMFFNNLFTIGYCRCYGENVRDSPTIKRI